MRKKCKIFQKINPKEKDRVLNNMNSYSINTIFDKEGNIIEKTKY